jgi:hypothetical protein
MDEQMVTVTLPDGKTVDLPASMSREEQERVVGEYWDAQQKPPVFPDAGIGDAMVGVAKGVGKMITGGGDLIRRAVPATAAFDVDTGGSRANLEPTNTAQKVGSFIGRTGISAIPAVRAAQGASLLTAGAPAAVRLGAQMAAGAGTNVATGKMQGSETPGWDAALGAAGPVVGGAALKVGRWIGSKAVPLAQSALKTPLSVLTSMQGAAREGKDAMSKRIANTVLDNRLFNEKTATAAIDKSMGNVDAKLAAQSALGVVTDAPRRADRYLRALFRGAGKNPTSAGNTAEATVAAEREALKNRGFGEDVVTGSRQVPSPSGLLGPNGKPLTVTEDVVERRLRDTVPVQESRDAALAMSRYSRANWGGTQSVSDEASKAVQRGTRDAVKSAVPRGHALDTRADFAQAQKVIKAREALRIMHVRDANRDMLSLPFSVGNAAAAASGTPAPAMIGFAQQLIKNKTLNLGIHARDLQKAIDAGDAVAIGRILQKLGVAAASDVPREGGMTIRSDGTQDGGQ